MAATRRNAITGEEMKTARLKRGWSQKRLADELGLRQNTIAQIELGTTKKSKHLSDIARILDDPAQTSKQKRNEAVTISNNELVGDRDLPLFAAVEAGDGMLVIGSDPMGWERRPAPLANVKSGYGLMVVGESMVPILRPGDTALIHPHLPPRAEDVVVFVSEKDGEVTATIKEYVGQTKDHWKVKRYQPKEHSFLLKKADWRVHGVMVGNYRRR